MSLNHWNKVIIVFLIPKNIWNDISLDIQFISYFQHGGHLEFQNGRQWAGLHGWKGYFFFIWLSSTICQKEFPVLSFYRIFPHSHDTNSVLATTLEFENKEYLLHFHLNPKGRTMDYHYQAKLLILNKLMHLF